MIRIGVLSDTHIPRRAKELPPVLVHAFQGVDQILHAGDIADITVIRKLSAIAPVSAVAGNTDPIALHQLWGEKKIVETGCHRIGMVHGDGEKGTTIERALDCFRGEKVDCIVFGHSHNPYCRYHGDILLFNPGSPTDKRRNEYYSFGLIEIDTTLKPQIIFFDKGNEVKGIYRFDHQQSICKPLP